MSNIQFQENRAYARNVVGAPTYNNRWSNNWLEKRVPSTTFYAAFPSANYKNSTNLVGSCNYVPATNYKATTSTVAARAPVFSPKANDDDDDNDNNNNKLIAFHSSNRWKEYFQASKHSNKLIVMYFTAIWCGPCRSMEPTIKELAAKYTGVEVVKLDVDELFNVSREFGIQTMPTFLFMKNGEKVDKVIGARPIDLQRKIEKHRV
ncbi:thioredoxin H7 [Beta vulgaris subsp. vulgaris]|uniref:thioredoxin H7 n=1 Tax=Beta vulgaris subsp. vulgaris TaxID=3555 RepID=UPI0020374BE0|nr:thioredoxin H7 [Beta vulgaris subsp. vulgaris]